VRPGGSEWVGQAGQENISPSKRFVLQFLLLLLLFFAFCFLFFIVVVVLQLDLHVSLFRNSAICT